MSMEQGKLTGFEAHFLITFENSTLDKFDNIMMELSNFGKIKRIDSNNFKIQSPLDKEELSKEISCLLNIDDTNFKIMHVGDLNVMI